MSYPDPEIVKSDGLLRLKWEEERERASCPELLCFGTADMDYRSPKPILASLKSVLDRGHLGYPKIPDTYYEAIHDCLLQIAGWNVDTRCCVLQNSGIYELAWGALQLLTKPGDAVTILTPVHSVFKELLTLNNRKTLECPLLLKNGFYEFVMIGFCMFMGFKWERLDAAMADGVRQVATAAMIMLLVGCMVAAWISSGTIPTLLYYGMKIITPKLFLPICFLVPAFMAICTRTSWGSISTIGVVLCGMAAGLGIPVGMAAGAVISGAFFGDKTSPLSDTTLLTASACEVPLFKHIASMWYTTLPGTLICLVLYTLLGLKAFGNIDVAAVNELSNGLTSNFHISPLHIIPVALALILSVRQAPTLLAFGTGIGSGIIWSMIFQGRGFMENLNYIYYERFFH